MSDVPTDGVTAPQGRPRDDVFDALYRHGRTLGAAPDGRPRLQPHQIKRLSLIRGPQPGPNLFWFPRPAGWRCGDLLYFLMNGWDEGDLGRSAAFWTAHNLNDLADNVYALTGWVDGVLGVHAPRPRSLKRRR